jgi:hypothetical protein
MRTMPDESCPRALPQSTIPQTAEADKAIDLRVNIAFLPELLKVAVRRWLERANRAGRLVIQFFCRGVRRRNYQFLAGTQPGDLEPYAG